MLIIVSDIHLGDETCGKSISPNAFALFSERLGELAYHASFRSDGQYKPVEKIDLVLMGDILDPLHSSLWLDGKPGSADYLRPWSDPSNPRYAAKLQQVTRAILRENQLSVGMLKRLAIEEIIRLPPALKGAPDSDSRERIPPRVNIHYMIGNHDWFYHLPGKDFDAIRQELIDAMGLSNPANNFPWEISEHEPLQDVFARYKVYGHHGDKYDRFNYDRERGRDFGTLGDVFAVEVLNRYPVAVAEQFGDELPQAIVSSLRMLTNVRPALATSLWITGQIRQHAGSSALEKKLKKIWDQVSEEFLQVDFVREADKAFQFDLVDAMELVVKVSKKASFKTINDLMLWIRNKMWEGEISYANHALREPAFLDNSARYVVYGHTHHHEIIPLDAEGEPPYEESQIYFNSGTWRSYYDLAVRDPKAQKFVPYQSMTYLTFYDAEERGERHFETWTGAFV
jgi:UDP-2,3-diacylglucosamine pyrophosphatase LpxH